ncbi:MAG: imidazolonepropionase [Flavobacteriales bacterium]|jgi:imidazolonepropionase|nr:imidazolonepropionase [Flavobacteriales bacterium]MDB9931721.1 imidazolonepropionase [Flavobacteriales bacterium]|tara:strand:+ start:5532 stop:6764 length:1233 start_codon:yes stop_codon:yes gene_type:complete
MKTFLINIKQLAGIQEDISKLKLKGKEMGVLTTLENAYLEIENGLISGFGEMRSLPNTDNSKIEDCSGKVVLPAWCDSHTHLVFAGTRETEFVDRINGLTYEEVAARGGGIINSAKRLQTATEEELYQAAWTRLEEIKSMGTGAVEIKSGYGLSFDAELKILRVIKRLKAESDLTIKATFLGAHAVPPEFKGNKDGYLDMLINEVLPVIKEENLADYIDIFCETNYFTVADAERIMEAGASIGLQSKIHVNQFTSIGGIQAGIKHKALSLDHLEVMTDEDIEDLHKSETMPTALPSCSFFLKIPFAPVRKMIDQGLAIALATDYNPGSTPSGKIPFVISLACIYQRLTPEEAINAVTMNSAYAMGISDTHGSITVGKKANLIITKEISSYNYIPYAFGGNHVERVILGGK